MSSIVSVIIPAYNSSRTIGRAIESVLAQGDGLEIIVVDDGSADATFSVASRYQDNGVCVLRQSRGGACAARNYGIGESRGDLIKFLDADDVLLPGAIKEQLAASVPLPSNHIVCGRSIKQGRVRPNDEDVHLLNGKNAQLAWLVTKNLQTSLPLHRRSALEYVGGFDESLSREQEYDLHIRLALNGYHFVCIDSPVVEIVPHDSADRITRQNVSESHFTESFKADEFRFDLVRHAFPDGVPFDVVDALASRYWRLGRTAAQLEFQAAANTYFALARLVDPEIDAADNRLFKAGSLLVGPYLAEVCIERVRRVLGRSRHDAVH